MGLRSGLVVWAVLAAVAATGAAPPIQDPDEPVDVAEPIEDEIISIPAPEVRPPHIRAMDLAESPVPGTGRLRIAFDGNRRWCTAQDDRVVKQNPPQGRKPARGATTIVTFGYQMILAAVKRGSADEAILLFESPLIRTATWRPASKAGLTPNVATPSPQVSDSGATVPPARRIAPGDLVPYWSEINRCATVAERMDFDLAPGVYDLYLAIDLLTRSGVYIHRATTFLLDVAVEEGRHTQVEGRVDMRGGGLRDVKLLAASPPGAAGPAGAAAPEGTGGTATRDP